MSLKNYVNENERNEQVKAYLKQQLGELLPENRPIKIYELERVIDKDN